MKFEPIGTKPGEYGLVEVGERFGPITYPVDDHIIKTYAFTQNDYNPWYFTDETPFGHRIAHASILANDLLTIFLTAYDPTNVIGLHTQEELWFYSPIRAGENVTIQAEYVEKYEKNGKGHVVLEAQAAGEAGRPIIRHRGIEIMRIMAAGLPAKKRAAAPPAGAVTGEYDAAIPAARRAGAQLAPGTPIAPLHKTTTAEQTQVYSWVGKHFINIHNNLAMAKKAGYENLVVQGQQLVGFVTEMLTNFFGASWFTSGYEKIKMVKHIYAGEALTFGGVVKDKTEEAGKTRLHLHVWGKNAKGEMVVLGWANALAD